MSALISHDVYKNIGLALLRELKTVLKNSGEYINEKNGYATLLLPNDMKIRFTSWRKGTMPYYIILFDEGDNYIFELDLSMIVYTDDIFSWNLKNPTNEINKNLLKHILGDKKKFPKEYSNSVRNVKINLKSGVKGVKQGFMFVNNTDFNFLVERLIELMNRVIVAHTKSSKSKNYLFSQAKDDEKNEYTQKKIRRNQSHFRLNLIQVYGLRCMISRIEISELIDAAHIISHSDSGINHTNNGLLLRIDLHRLFDANLLGINPKTFTVKISKNLKNTEYEKFDGVKISLKNDGSYLDDRFLIEKWKCFN